MYLTACVLCSVSLKRVSEVAASITISKAKRSRVDGEPDMVGGRPSEA